MIKKQKTNLQFSTFIISFLIIFQAVALLVSHKTNQHDKVVKNYQINSLITEVGELKTENDQLSQRLHEQGKLMGSAAESLKKIEKNIQEESNSTLKSESEAEKEVKTLQIQLNTLQAIFQKELKTKDEIIQKLNLTQAEKEKIAELNNKVKNILILGENQGLTDTIVIASINPAKNKINLISIPRDLYYKGRKINEYYQKYGIEEFQSVLKEMTALSIDNYIKVSFEAFQEFINLVGGVDIEIAKKIVDDQYPGPNNSYQTVTFEKGKEHLSGERALQYARSRKSTSDFDRMERQQQILKSLKEKMKELGIMNNLGSLTKVYQTIQKNITTNLNLLDILSLFEQAKDFEIVKGNVLSNQNFLYSSKTANGQYILLPLDSSFQTIQKAIIKSVE